jgi:hypothetical protein
LLLLLLFFSSGFQLANLSLHLGAVGSVGSLAQVAAVQLDSIGKLTQLPVALGDVVEEGSVWSQPIRLFEFLQRLAILT